MDLVYVFAAKHPVCRLVSCVNTRSLTCVRRSCREWHGSSTSGGSPSMGEAVVSLSRSSSFGSSAFFLCCTIIVYRTPVSASTSCISLPWRKQPVTSYSQIRVLNFTPLDTRRIIEDF